MDNLLKKEFEYYLKHQDDFVKQYEGKFIVIKDKKVMGEYENALNAVSETQKQHKPGTFLVQLVSPGNTAYTQTFHSRVAFR